MTPTQFAGMLPPQAPEMSGDAGMVWHYDIDGILRRSPGGPSRELTVAAWLVHAPVAHPVWHGYAVLGVCLRDMPGAPKAVINLAGATHEIIVMALNPDFPLLIDDRPHFLHPANFAGQFIAPSDDAASQRIRAVVQEVVDGVLSPDTDARRDWVARFGDSMLKRDRPLDDQIVTLADGSVVAVGTGKATVETLAAAAALGIDIKAETKQ